MKAVTCIVLTGMALAACARNEAVFIRGDAAEAQIQTDIAACRQGAELLARQIAYYGGFAAGFSAGMTSGYTEAAARHAALITCMQGKGYRYRVLTADEKSEYNRLAAPAEKDAFLRKLWAASPPPNPGTAPISPESNDNSGKGGAPREKQN